MRTQVVAYNKTKKRFVKNDFFENEEDAKKAFEIAKNFVRSFKTFYESNHNFTVVLTNEKTIQVEKI